MSLLSSMFHTFVTILILTDLLVSGALGQRCSPSGAVDIDPSEFAQIKFDFLIIGGGTAGVALSARLAENPSVKVGLIEAGELHLNDQIVDVPAFSGVGNASYDWEFVSTPQVNAANRNLSLPRGKLLGGSSGINGMAWGRASAVEYNAWSSFAGNTSWSWSGILPYMKKSESFSTTPTNPYPGISAAQAAHAHSDIPRVDGFDGPIVASLNSQYFDVIPAMVETMNDFGIRTNTEPQAGNATGVTNTLTSIDRVEGVRSYAATTYYCSHANLSNYHVLLNARATKILFENTKKGLTATSVEFLHGGNQFTASARNEVILSAGTIQTPQLLELSGIGNPEILKKYGVQILMDLPGVGENFQEHLFVGVQWQLKPGVQTFDILRNNATFAAEQAAQYAKNRTGLLAATNSLVAFLPLQDFVSDDRLQVLLSIFDKEAIAANISALQHKQNQVQQPWFADGSAAAVELIQSDEGSINPTQGNSYVVLLGGVMHPASRGSVHISSGDPLQPPAINPDFLSHDFDSQVLLDVLKFMQELGRSPPFSEYVAVQTSPDVTSQTDEDLLTYIRSTSAGGDHLVGTAPMAPREVGGVVDHTLTVYGTTNLRIVDASIFPFQIACHSQATVYAIAEKAADMIKASH